VAYYQDTHVTIYNGSCLSMDIPDNSIQCVVTSPPYWGLRKYSGEQEIAEWGCSFGLEPTPEMYVAHTVEVLREIRRVLRKDGVVFWNIGDSYATNHAEVGTIDKETGWTSATALIDMKERGRTSTKGHNTLKPKDLCLIPFRVAIAAQEDGWWVRSVIIWSKPNPMPESVQDRPTESHEYILMLTKNARYFWDIDAVREEYSPTVRWGGDKYKGAVKEALHGEDAGLDRERNCFPSNGRNLRSVWGFPTQPYPDAHFAVFPEALPQKCIMAATPEAGCCSECGSPWERVTETSRSYNSGSGKAGNKPNGKWADQEEAIGSLEDDIRAGPCVSVKTLGWRPTCQCCVKALKAEGKTTIADINEWNLKHITPSTVLDPFAGSGTVGKVAKSLGRKAILYDLSSEYCAMAKKRIEQVAIPMF